jgi:polar amino acid transport system substrate-binding protein
MTKTVLKITLAAAALTLAASFAGCGKEKPTVGKAGEQAASEPRSFRAEDFADKTFAILSGSSFDAVAREAIGVKLVKYYNSPAEAIEAVKRGEADATLVEEPVARKFASQNDDITVVYPPVDIENYASIFPKKDNGALRDEFNAFLLKTRSDGIYDDMIKRWVDSPVSPAMPEITLNPTKKRKLSFVTSDCDPPFAFKTAEGKVEGFDVELALRFAQAQGYDLEVRVMEFPDMIPTIQAGGADFASNLITITDERKTFVDFSEPLYYGGTVVVAKK